MKRIITAVFMLVFLFSGSVLYAVEKSWRDRFDEICSRVQIAESLSESELQSLIKRSDELMKELKTLKLPARKVYIFRLKKCKAFFEYIIQLKESKNKH